MEKFDSYFHPILKIVALVEPGDRKPTNFLDLSELIHSELEDIVGSYGYHVLFHHVLRDLLIDHGISDLIYYQITDSKSFPSYKDAELELFLDYLDTLQSSDYMINTWIDLDVIMKEARLLIDWPFVQRVDTQEILGRLRIAYDALVPRLPKACPYVIEGTFSTVVDNEDYAMLLGSQESIALLDREHALYLDLQNNPDKYEGYAPWNTLSGITLTGNKPYAMEFEVHSGDEFEVILGGYYGEESELLKVTINSTVLAEVNNHVIGGTSSLSFPLRFGIWIDPVTKEVGVTTEKGHYFNDTPFLTNQNIDVLGLQIKYTGTNDGKMFWYKNADDYELLYPKHSIGLCTGVAPNNIADKTRLQIAINRGQKLDSYGYTEDSFTTLQNAIQNGIDTVNDYYANQVQVDTAENNIYEAIVNLIPSVWEPEEVIIDKSALVDAINSTSSLVQSTYTVCSWDNYLPHLTEANRVNGDSTVDQNQVDKATQNLTDAINNLEALVDRSDVIALLETIDGLNKMNYTPKSWINMNNYVELARTLLANPCFVYFLDIHSDLLEAYNNLEERGIMWDHGLPWDNLLGWRDE